MMQKQTENQNREDNQKNSQHRRGGHFYRTAAACGKDIVKAFLIGLAVAGVIGLVLFLGGFAVKGGKPLAGLEAMKDGLFLILAILLFLLAGMLLMKGKKQEEMQDREGWRRHFSVLGVKMVLACISIGFLLVAAAADYLIWGIG